MIAHPFEIKPSADSQAPDVLMITCRGTPDQSIAEMYLPTVSSKAVIALADRIYGRHRLTATDANTIQFPAGDLALVPIPAGTGRYAGLLSVEIHPSLPEGKTFTVSVRQLYQASATVRTAPPPPPPPPQPKIALTERESSGSNKETFSWRQVQGAFQYTVTVKPANTLLSEQERLTAWLKWRVGVTPAGNRWLPVLKRYLTYTENLVWGLGKDPNTIPPSEVGKITGEGSGGTKGTGSTKGSGSGSGKPAGTHDAEEHECTGKVASIHYDAFGDFRGFTILSEFGHERYYVATEHSIEELVREAWVERTVVKVFSKEHEPERPERLLLLRFH